MRRACDGLKIEPEMIKIGLQGVECHCYKDSEDDYYSWYLKFHNIGHIGEYRLAVDTEFDRMENIFRLPERLPDVHVKLYLTILEDNFSNPWADIEKTYPIYTSQISDQCSRLISKLIYSSITEFDRKNKKHKPFEDWEETWGCNFFRMIKEDFNPGEDIKILFEDGKVWKGYNTPDPLEKVEKYHKEIEELKPYLK